MTNSTPNPAPVQRSVQVLVEPARAFDVFTKEMLEWWNPAYSANPQKTPYADIILERAIGGRWFERAVDGSEHEWARVIAYEPAVRLVANWLAAGAPTELEFRFESPAPRRTDVTAIHSGFERLGKNAQRMRDVHDACWLDLLERFAEAVRKNAAAIHHDASAPRAVTDGETVLATVDVPVAPERVFRAVTTRETEAWWGAPDTYRITDWKSDLRVGGSWSCVIVLHDGSQFPASGKYLAIEPGRRVVATRRYDWDYPELGRRDTTVTYLMEPIAAGTRVTVRQDGFAGLRAPADHHAEGWEGFLKYLSAYLSAEVGR